jgi:parallel beta-helix repeat protein
MKEYILRLLVVSIFGVALATALGAAPVFGSSCLPAGSTGLTAYKVASSHETITGTIDATGCDVGVYIAPGTTDVVITDANVTGANDHGIFTQDASKITIEHSLVTGNAVASHSGVADDKAIELVGTSNSIITDNVVSHNKHGGISITDDGPVNPGAPNTGTPHKGENNVIKGNLIDDNENDCGIILAAYNSGVGIRNNKVIDNTIVGSPPPFAPPLYIGQIVIATDRPNTTVSNTEVVGNYLDGSMLPGIVVHANVFGDQILQTQIMQNILYNNGYYPTLFITPNDPGVSNGSTGIALIAEVGVQPPNTQSPVLSQTNVYSNTVLGDTNGVWLCGTDKTNIKHLQGNPTNPIVICSAGGS